MLPLPQLQSEGALDDMIKRGIQYIHTYCVDNILVKVADPVFVGYADEVGVGCAAKVVPKESPHEKVGVVCKVGGQFKVVEYSEISNVTAERRSEDGSLMFNAGNICNHLFSIDFLKNCCDRHLALQHHVARKCIKYCDDQGNALVTPPSENGIKLELFVFDVFEVSWWTPVLRVYPLIVPLCVFFWKRVHAVCRSSCTNGGKARTRVQPAQEQKGQGW